MPPRQEKSLFYFAPRREIAVCLSKLVVNNFLQFGNGDDVKAAFVEYISSIDQKVFLIQWEVPCGFGLPRAGFKKFYQRHYVNRF